MTHSLTHSFIHSFTSIYENNHILDEYKYEYKNKYKIYRFSKTWMLLLGTLHFNMCMDRLSLLLQASTEFVSANDPRQKTT